MLKTGKGRKVIFACLLIHGQGGCTDSRVMFMYIRIDFCEGNGLGGYVSKNSIYTLISHLHIGPDEELFFVEVSSNRCFHICL